jgi:uncharacterized protein (TIGR00251 family)
MHPCFTVPPVKRNTFCLPHRPAPAQSATVSSCTLELKTIPNAPRNELAGWLGDALKIKVHAPALDGRANDALLLFLAEKLGVPRRTLTLVRGDKSRHKIVRIDNLALVEAKVRLGLPDNAAL